MDEQAVGAERDLEATRTAELADRVIGNLQRVIHAPEETLQFSFLCLLAEGHLIIEDFPGVGKTSLAKALARSIDCASPKTQAALLECMQERQVTVDGVSYQLPPPFMVMATQNPIEYEGTSPLPEAELDRFTMRIAIGYPPLSEEAKMLTEQTAEPPLDALEPVASEADEIGLADKARGICVEESLNR